MLNYFIFSSSSFRYHVNSLPRILDPVARLDQFFHEIVPILSNLGTRTSYF
jgi:hypothetical protein